MHSDDRVRLKHMLDAANDAVSFIDGRSRADLDGDKMLTLSLVRCLEIIGEAAGRSSDECRIACPRLPWQEMIGMRNRLIHAYFDINHDILW